MAGIIMVIAAGRALFTEPPRSPRVETAAIVVPPEQPAAKPQIVTAAVAVPDNSAEPVEPDEGRPSRHGREALGRLEPLAMVPLSAMRRAEEELAVEEAEEAEEAWPSPEPARFADPADFVSRVGSNLAGSPPGGSLDEPETTASLGAEGSTVEVALRTPAETTMDAPAEQTIDAVATDAPAAKARQGESPWGETAVTCPRDWLDGTHEEFVEELSASCGPKFVLVAPVPSAEVSEEPAEEPMLDEALEAAAAAKAIKLTGFAPRVPEPRPDPPPVRKVSNSHRADWPDEPPPNCGALHAYWRFVDRAKGIKEWYCR